jgi:hypothetical protein
MLHYRPDCSVVMFRGNVATRLAKLAAGEAEVTLLAAAGLNRPLAADRSAASSARSAAISLGGNERLPELIAVPPPDHSGDDHVYRSCSRKFALLTESVLTSLGDDRLLALVGADPAKWSEEHLKALDFLLTQLSLMRQLSDAGFLNTEADLSSLARALFRLKDSLEREVDAHARRHARRKESPHAQAQFIRYVLTASATPAATGAALDKGTLAEADAAVSGMVASARNQSASIAAQGEEAAGAAARARAGTANGRRDRASTSLEMVENPFAFKGSRRASAPAKETDGSPLVGPQRGRDG